MVIILWFCREVETTPQDKAKKAQRPRQAQSLYQYLSLTTPCSCQGKPETLELGAIPCNWLVLPSGCAPVRCTSHLTQASPAGQECHPRAHPAMGVRSGMERGCRPRDGAPQCLSWGTAGYLSRGAEGKADGLQQPEGSSLSRGRVSGGDPTGG